MARTKRQADEREAIRRERVRREAMRGSAALAGSLAYARQVLARLEEPGGRFGRRHEHAEPFEHRGCGWCGNVRSWRAMLAQLSEAQPIAQAMEAALARCAANRTQAALWAEAQIAFPGVTRELVRAIWARARACS